MRLDIVRIREGQRDWESCNLTRKRRTCEATPTDLVGEPKESCTVATRTEACVAPSHHVDASRYFIAFPPDGQRVGGAGGRRMIGIGQRVETTVNNIVAMEVNLNRGENLR